MAKLRLLVTFHDSNGEYDAASMDLTEGVVNALELGKAIGKFVDGTDPGLFESYCIDAGKGGRFAQEVVGCWLLLCEVYQIKLDPLEVTRILSEL